MAHLPHSLKNKSPVFLSTQWSMVLGAGDLNSKEGRSALEELCHAYWYPLYAFVRRKGYQAADAQDLTQGFFAELIETHTFKKADPERGKFRSFLLGAMRYYLADQRKKAKRLKRGGGARFLSLDETMEAEQSYQRDLQIGATFEPEVAYEKQWGERLVALTFNRLQQEFHLKGKATLYEALVGYLLPDGAVLSYEKSAAKLGRSPSAVKSAIHRLRQRYGVLLREEVARTVSDESEVEDEIRHLIISLG